MCKLSIVVVFLLVSLATSEVIDLSNNTDVASWPSSSYLGPSITITMCWGEFILERTEDTETKLTVETNIWSSLNVNGGVIDTVSTDLIFDFSKAGGLEETLGSNEDVYLRVRLFVPSTFVIRRIWTTGLFDYYHDSSFPEDFNFGSYKDSIGKTTTPPEKLKTTSASNYPEGKCDDNYHTNDIVNPSLNTTIIIAGSVFGGIVLLTVFGGIVFLTIVGRTVSGTAQGVSSSTATPIVTTTGIVSMQSHQTHNGFQQQQGMPQSYTIGGNLSVAQPVLSSEDTSTKYDDDEKFGISGFR